MPATSKDVLEPMKGALLAISDARHPSGRWWDH
jgi:hypothetical protein